MLNFKKWMAEIGIPFTMAGPCGPDTDSEGRARAMPTINPDDTPPIPEKQIERRMKKKMRRK